MMPGTCTSRSVKRAKRAGACTISSCELGSTSRAIDPLAVKAAPIFSATTVWLATNCAGSRDREMRRRKTPTLSRNATGSTYLEGGEVN